MDMTFYALDRVEPFSRAAGCLRAATSAELDELAPLAMAAEWEMHVVEERPDPAEIERTLRQAIDDGRQFVWVDGSTIRAIASYVSPFSHAGARNSWSVYTSGIPGARVWNCDHWFAGGEIVEGRPSLGGVVCG